MSLTKKRIPNIHIKNDQKIRMGTHVNNGMNLLNDTFILFAE